ncbi:MAG: MFS transporter [Lachnospiraceae bacterium]|nr:MFS transporter [Lachnospiraceae bacterium]
MGIIIFSEYAGFFISTFLAGLLADLFGQKFTLIIAGIFLIGGVIGYAASANLILLIGFIFFIGLGAGSLELSGSNIISGIHKEDKARYLNLLNAFYGIGSIIVPIFVSIFFRPGTSWRTVYRYSLFVIIPIILYFVIMEFPEQNTFKRQTGKMNPEEILHSILKHGGLAGGVFAKS